MSQPPQTRSARSRALVTNALTKPVNIAVPTVLVVAGLLLHLLLVFVPLAVVSYGLLAAFTLFDEDEAHKVLASGRKAALGPAPELEVTGYPPRIAEAMQDAVAEQRKIQEAIAQSGQDYSEVATEIGVLLRETERVAKKAAVIDAYLSDEDVQEAPRRLGRLRQEGSPEDAASDARRLALEALEAQVKIRDELDVQLQRSFAELDHLVASLGVIRGQIVRMSVAEDVAVQTDVGSQVRDLRERVTTLADGMTEAVAKVGAG